MKITVYDDSQAFVEKARPFLLQHEALNCVLIGLTTTIIKTPDVYPDPYLAVVEDADEVVAVCMRTPPNRPLLAQTTRLEAVRLIAADLANRYGTLPGVIAAVEVAREFVSVWRTQAHRIGFKECIFQLETVNPAAGAGVSGTLRRATRDDRDLLVQWWYEFALEAVHEDNREQAEKSISNVFSTDHAHRGIFLWEDAGQIVSMSGYTGPTPNGIRIGPVYTPPQFRGHGYASACVAQLSQLLLNEGRKYCFLFTDLSNPTSNHIYQVIGYRPVADVDMYNFDPVAD